MRRTGRRSVLSKSVSRMPDFETHDSCRVWDVIAVVVMGGRHRGEAVAAVEVVMVIMTFRAVPTGAARSRSTGNNFLGSRLGTSRIG